MRRGEALCRPCYRERLWRAWRGLVLVVALVAGLGGAAQGDLLALPVAALVAAGWTWLSTRAIALAVGDRRARSLTDE